MPRAALSAKNGSVLSLPQVISPNLPGGISLTSILGPSGQGDGRPSPSMARTAGAPLMSARSGDSTKLASGRSAALTDHERSMRVGRGAFTSPCMTQQLELKRQHPAALPAALASLRTSGGGASQPAGG